MRPDVVTFWHGQLDLLRLTCLRSQVAAGHKVTVYSFDPIPGLPDGIENAEAEAILPHSFSERLRPPEPDGSWRDWTILQFSDFFRMRLMAENAGLWLDADVLLLKPIEIDPAKPHFAWERGRMLGNSVLYLPSHDGIVRAFEGLIEQEDLVPEWLALRHRVTFMLRQWSGRSNRLSDTRIAMYGPAALTALARREGTIKHALPMKSYYAVHSDQRRFFEPANFSKLLTDPDVIGLHLSPKGRAKQQPMPGSMFAWAVEKFA